MTENGLRKHTRAIYKCTFHHRLVEEQLTYTVQRNKTPYTQRPQSLQFDAATRDTRTFWQAWNAEWIK